MKNIPTTILVVILFAVLLFLISHIGIAFYDDSAHLSRLADGTKEIVFTVDFVAWASLLVSILIGTGYWFYRSLLKRLKEDISDELNEAESVNLVSQSMRHYEMFDKFKAYSYNNSACIGLLSEAIALSESAIRAASKLSGNTYQETRVNMIARAASNKAFFYYEVHELFDGSDAEENTDAEKELKRDYKKLAIDTLAKHSNELNTNRSCKVTKKGLEWWDIAESVIFVKYKLGRSEDREKLIEEKDKLVANCWLCEKWREQVEKAWTEQAKKIIE